jgi:hypothetical protein
MRPILPTQVAAAGADSYLNVDEICRNRPAAGAVPPQEIPAPDDPYE